MLAWKIMVITECPISTRRWRYSTHSNHVWLIISNRIDIIWLCDDVYQEFNWIVCQSYTLTRQNCVNVRLIIDLTNTNNLTNHDVYQGYDLQINYVPVYAMKSHTIANTTLICERSPITNFWRQTSSGFRDYSSLVFSFAALTTSLSSSDQYIMPKYYMKYDKQGKWGHYDEG